MKYLPYLLIALCFCMTLGLAKAVKTTVSDLKEENRLLREEIVQLRADMEFHNQNAQRVIDEVRHIMSGKNFVPVWDYRTFLVWDTEEIIKESHEEK